MSVALRLVPTDPVIQDLPAPDEAAAAAELARLTGLDVPGAGFGVLARAVAFVAGTQGAAVPRPWRSPRVLVLRGDHAGGAAAGTIPGESGRRAALARKGAGPLGVLAARAGATVQVVDAPPARPMELAPALDSTEVDKALRYGWRLAEEAADAGVDVLVIGSCGSGTDAAAAAVLAAVLDVEPAAVLPRAVVAGGRVDDAAWMVRCAAVRDALFRIRPRRPEVRETPADHSFSRIFKANRQRSRRGAREVLAEVGGGDLTIAVGVLLGAAARRTPVLVDGPVAAVAGIGRAELAGHHGSQGRPGLDHQVGAGQLARARPQPPVVNLCVDDHLTEAQLVTDVQAGGGLGPKRGAQRHHQRACGHDLVFVGFAERLRAPSTEVKDDLFEPTAELGQLVDDRAIGARGDAAAHQAAPLELLQAVREDVGRNPGQPCPQVGVALGADQQVPHDQQRPPLAHQLKRARYAAELPVPAPCHGSKIARDCLDAGYLFLACLVQTMDKPTDRGHGRASPPTAARRRHGRGGAGTRSARHEVSQTGGKSRCARAESLESFVDAGRSGSCSGSGSSWPWRSGRWPGTWRAYKRMT